MLDVFVNVKNVRKLMLPFPLAPGKPIKRRDCRALERVTRRRPLNELFEWCIYRKRDQDVIRDDGGRHYGLTDADGNGQRR